MVMSDPQKFREKIEALDTETLRNNLALNKYGSPEKNNLVKEILRKREQLKQDEIKEREISIAEKALESSQRSAEAAKKSADEATESRKLKRLSLFLSGSALLVSILSLYFSLKKDG